MKIKLLIFTMLIALGAKAQFTNFNPYGVQQKITGIDTTFRLLGSASGKYIYPLTKGSADKLYNLTFSNGLTKTGNSVGLGGNYTGSVLVGGFTGSNGYLYLTDSYAALGNPLGSNFSAIGGSVEMSSTNPENPSTSSGIRFNYSSLNVITDALNKGLYGGSNYFRNYNPASDSLLYAQYGGVQRMVDSSSKFNSFRTFADTAIVKPATGESKATWACVIKNAGKYYMYYTRETASQMNIWRKESFDGKTGWTNPVLVIDKGATGKFDEVQTWLPNVWIEGGTWYMLYTGRSSALQNSIGLATSSDGTTWTRSNSGNAVISGTALAWDAGDVELGSVIKKGNTYYLNYNKIEDERQTGTATSTDLINWTKNPANPIMTGGRFCGNVFKINKYYYMVIPHYLTRPYSELEIYRDTIPTFLPASRQYLGVVYSTTATGWDNAQLDVPYMLTDDIYRNTYNSSNGQLWLYYSGTDYALVSGLRYWSEGMLIASKDFPFDIPSLTIPSRGDGMGIYKSLVSTDLKVNNISTVSGNEVGVANHFRAGSAVGQLNSNIEANSNTGSTTIVPTTIAIKSNVSSSTWNTATNWGNLDFFSDDASGPGVGVRARIGSRFTNATAAGPTRLTFSAASGTSLMEHLYIDGSTGLNLPLLTASSLLKLDASKNVTVAVAGTDYATPTYADAKVQNSLTASTTIAPSATAVNNGLDLKANLGGNNNYTTGYNTYTAVSSNYFNGGGISLSAGAFGSYPSNSIGFNGNSVYNSATELCYYGPNAISFTNNGYSAQIKPNSTLTSNTTHTLPSRSGTLVNILDTGTKQVKTASGNGSATTISIAHGMFNVTSSSWVSAIANNAASAGIQYVTVDATNVNITYTVAPASGTNNLLYSIEVKP